MRTRRPTALLTVLATSIGAVLALHGPAGASAEHHPRAGAGGPWTKVSTGVVDALSEITTVRTADGALHAVYATRVGSSDRYEHARLSAAGSVTGRNAVLSPWATLVGDPELVSAPDGGLRLVFSGLQDADTANFYSQGYAYSASATATGATWTLRPEALTRSTSAYSGYGLAATLLSDGTPVTASVLDDGVVHRAGAISATDPMTVQAAAADSAFALPACCGYDLSMVSAHGRTWLAWYANGGTPASNGVFVRQVYPALGPVSKVPGSSVGASSIDPGQRVALVARPDGSVVLAYLVGYPVARGVGLWRVGAPSAKVVAAGRGATRVALSVGATGRLWLAWADREGGVFAARSAVTGLTLGAPRFWGRPHHASPVRALTVDGALARGTVLAQSASSVWARQVLPGLTVSASPLVWKRTSRRAVVFIASDAGARVAGVRIAGGGRSCTTRATGRCAVVYPPSRRARTVVVTARKRGYAPAVLHLRPR
jgi:hypothetical protein